MNERHDLKLILDSGAPIVVIETREESRVLELLTRLTGEGRTRRLLFRWSITEGLRRLDVDMAPQRHNTQPDDVLRHIRAARQAGVYALLDFHPFLQDPVNVRLLKDIAIDNPQTGVTLVLISHAIELPAELEPLTVRFELRLPDEASRRAIIARVIAERRRAAPGIRITIDPQAVDILVDNLSGLTHADVERLARTAVCEDDAVTLDDVPAVMATKYRLLNRGGILSYEYDTGSFADVAGLDRIRSWLEQRRIAFSAGRPAGLDTPRGLLLIGVQGCGKSLAAKATAGLLGVPLLRLDFGALYNKYHGETERNLRESLNVAETMSPCVLWLDEIEKGVAFGHDESGTARRVLGALLTWMAERRSRVLLVATANDVTQLPPELVRKGRFDEIFFIDLPTPEERAAVFAIHLRKRELDPATIDIARLVEASDGFSGAEIEQAVVSALYTAHVQHRPPDTGHLSAELARTRPLSVVMAEKIAALRHWARDRTVPAS